MCYQETAPGFNDLEKPTYILPIKGALTEKNDWADFYPDAEDRLSNWMPEILLRDVIICAYVHANHVRNLLNRILHSGIIIYVNNAPTVLYSKRQNTVEASWTGIEFLVYI